LGCECLGEAIRELLCTSSQPRCFLGCLIGKPIDGAGLGAELIWPIIQKLALLCMVGATWISEIWGSEVWHEASACVCDNLACLGARK
jgi:hypothetical protein